MQNYKIPRTEILKLYESCLNEISAHSVGQWLKSVTEKQFVVIPREEILHLCHAFDDIEEGVLTTIETAKDIQEWL